MWYVELGLVGCIDTNVEIPASSNRETFAFILPSLDLAPKIGDVLDRKAVNFRDCFANGD